MTDTEAALLRAIAADPDEDTPRLVYADYLDELGGEVNTARAEYIRIQVRRQRGFAGADEDARLYRREVALYVEFAARWRQELPPGYDANVVSARRGFWHRARATARAVLAAADDPFAGLIDELTLGLDCGRYDLADVFASAHVRRLSALTVSTRGGTLTTADTHLLASVAFPRLERLDLSGHAIRNRGVDVLRLSSHFPQLRYLDLSGCQITDAGANLLLASSLIARLRRLTLTRNTFSPDTVHRLTTSYPGIVQCD